MATSADLRSRLGTPRSQGPLRSTCLAFAASAAHEIALFDDHHILDTCEEYLYWASKQRDTTTGPGTTFPAVRDALNAEGQPLEEVWPYDPWRDDQIATYQPPPGAHAAQPRWSPAFAAVPATPNSIRSELDAGRAVVLGMPTWPDLDLPVAGRLTVPSLADLDGGLHAVTIVGYDGTTAEMCIRNSWGATWGDDGHAWLPFRFLDEHLCETWVVDPIPRPPVSSSTSSSRYGSTQPAR